MRHTILLADDSPTIQRLVNQTFADTRFDIVTVNNGDAAIRKFDEIEPDVVLADIYMPGKNGYEVCAHVKGHASLSDIPVILLVGAFDAFDESTANQAGAAAHITKPFEPRALVELVTSTIPEGGRSRKTAKKDEPVKIEEPLVPEIPEVAKPAAMETPAETPAETVDEKPAEEPVAPVVTEIPHAVERIAESAAPVETTDLLGLEHLFPPESAPIPAILASNLTEEQIEKIADRVIRKLSTQVIEGIAWDVVPDIAAKVLRDEFKKTNS